MNTAFVPNEALSKALTAEDELGAIIRGHIHIEHALIDYIKKRLHPSHITEKICPTYNEKIQLAVLLGLSSDFEGGLKCVGKLRNKFAHTLEAKITLEDSNNLEKAMSTFKEVLVTANQRTHAKLVGKGSVKLFKNYPPRDKITLLMVGLYTIILAFDRMTLEKPIVK